MQQCELYTVRPTNSRIYVEVANSRDIFHHYQMPRRQRENQFQNKPILVLHGIVYFVAFLLFIAIYFLDFFSVQYLHH